MELAIAENQEALTDALACLRMRARRVAFVPTMGALHEGHAALVREGLKMADAVVASVFVNPTQFGPNEDFSRYPRGLAADAALLEAEGAAILYAPDAPGMYPEGFATSIRVAGASEGLCGASRPGHFEGVATVVAKLLNRVRPDIALFGEKDYQQLAVIRRMVRDLDMGVEIRGVPTVREPDGLALSSRNRYLSPKERAAAPALHAALTQAARAIQTGEAVADALEHAKSALQDAGFTPVEYLELRDAESLAPLASLTRPARLLASARLGTTRLIDNIPVEPA